MPDEIPRFDDWVKTAKPRRYDEDSALDLIAHHESGNRNIKQQIVPASGGYNPSVGRVTGPSTASGPWQITNSTWRKRAPRDIATKYPSAMSAPVEVQRAVAGKMYRETGFQDWEPYNASLRKAIARGEQPRSQVPAEIPNFDDWVKQSASPEPTSQAEAPITRPTPEAPTVEPGFMEALDRVTQSANQIQPQAAQPVLTRKPKVSSVVKDVDSGEALEMPKAIQFQAGTQDQGERVTGIGELERQKYIEKPAPSQLLSGEYTANLGKEGGHPEALSKAALRSLGVPDDLNTIYRQATGRNLLLVNNAKQDREGNFRYRVSQQAVNFINAFQSGLSEGGVDEGLRRAAEVNQAATQEIAAANEAAKQAASQDVTEARAAADRGVQSPFLRGVTGSAARAAQAFGSVLPMTDFQRKAQVMRAAAEQAEEERPLQGVGENIAAGVGEAIPTAMMFAATQPLGAAQLPALGAAEGFTPEERLQGAAQGLATHATFGIPNQLAPQIGGVAKRALTAGTVAGIPVGEALARGESPVRALAGSLPYAAMGALQGRGEAGPSREPLGLRRMSEMERPTVPEAQQRELRAGEIREQLAPFQGQPRLERTTGRPPAFTPEPANFTRDLITREATAQARPVESLAKPEPVIPAEPQGARKNVWQHRDFGRVQQAENQTGVGVGKVRVIDEQGVEHVIKRSNGRGQNNQIAIPVREAGPVQREGFTVIDKRGQPKEPAEVQPTGLPDGAATRVPEVEAASTPAVVTERTEASIEPSLSRAALQVAPASTTVPIPTTPITRTGELSFLKSAEKAGLPVGENRTYDVLTNPESLAKADAHIEKVGVDRAISDLAFKKDIGAEDTAMGIRLMRGLTNTGDHQRASEVAEDLANKLRRSGQATQAASLIARLSPEGVLLTAQRKLPAGKSLTAEQSEKLVGQAKRVEAVDTELANIARQEVEAKSPKLKRTTAEKIGTLEDRLLKLEQDKRAEIAARQEKAQMEVAGNAKGQRGSGINPAAVAVDLADYAVIGASKLARKGMSAAKWTAEMVSEFGDEIKPHLQKLYKDSFAVYNEQKDQMKSEAQERSARRGNVGPLRPEDIREFTKRKETTQKNAQKERREMLRLLDDLSMTKTRRVLETAVGLRRANLLSAAKTHIRNVTSNTAFQATEELSRPMAVMGDLIARATKRTGLRTTTGASLPASVRATYAAAIKEGPQRAADIMRGREVLPLEGYNNPIAESIESKMQLGESRTGVKLLDGYINTVFRTLEAEDAVFKIHAFRRELSDIAKTAALNEKAKDSSVKVGERSKYWQEHPTDSMLMEAATYADYATFQNKNQVSSAIAGGKRLIGTGGKFAIEQIAPFDRTPTNILARTLEYSPLGLVSAGRKFSRIGKKAEAARIANKVVDEAFTAQEQKDFARTFGRASTGTILTALAVILADKGLLSGASDYDTDKADYMQKRREFGGGGMLHVPGTNQRISIMDVPAGKAMATAAGMYELARSNKPIDQKLTGAGKMALDALVIDQPLVRGIREIGQSKSVGEAAGNYGASFVPGSSALRSAAEVADPKARIVRGSGATAPVRALLPPQVPGGRGSLPVDTGIIPSERGGVIRRIVRSVDPLNTTTEGKGPKKRLKQAARK